MSSSTARSSRSVRAEAEARTCGKEKRRFPTEQVLRSGRLRTGGREQASSRVPSLTRRRTARQWRAVRFSSSPTAREALLPVTGDRDDPPVSAHLSDAVVEVAGDVELLRSEHQREPPGSLGDDPLCVDSLTVYAGKRSRPLRCTRENGLPTRLDCSS